jgi:ElaB/YqjD/DUF883 family membrane-anchored ribosome-binding protein
MLMAPKTKTRGQPRASVEAFLDDLVNGGGSVLTKARNVASDYTQSATRAAQEGADQVREYASESYRQAGRMVQQRPGESMAVVFGIGFLSGLAVCLLMRRDA